MQHHSATRELQNEFAWSWSRNDAFYQCPRKFYWQYYGYWAAWEFDAPGDAKLAYRLRRVTSLPAFIGQVFHAVVSARLHLRSEGADAVPTAQLQDEIERRVLKGLRESRNRDWERFRDPKHYAILFEDYYGPGITAQEHDEALAAARECVKGFANSIYAIRAFAISKSRLRIIDPTDFDAMKITIDGVPAFAAPDLVVEDDRGWHHIVDWKTGQPQKANAAQLAVYGLYVSEKVGVPLERVSAHLVYVRSGEAQTHHGLDESVAEARRRVATYAADVRGRLTDVERNVAADRSRFPMTENLQLCRRCRFQELCGRMSDRPEPPTEPEDAVEG